MNAASTPATSKSETLKIARQNMIEHQIRCCKILDSELLDLLEAMPREDFVPQHVRSLAYMEGRVPLSNNQEMLSPLQEATIMQYLEFSGEDRVLEIGTGSGYLTNLLALRSAHVTSLEIHPDLAKSAEKNLADHGIDNADIITINALDESAVSESKSITGTYDIIVIGTALKEVPAHIRALLANSGQLVAFVGQNPVLHLVHEAHQNGVCTKTELMDTLLQDAEGLPAKRELVF